MTIVERFAKYEHLFRPAIAKMPHGFAVWFFSNGRKAFLNMLVDDKPDERVALNPDARKTLWDISFNNSLMNAAGMFKNGDGYYMAARQKAGAYLAGTTTALARTGNKRNNIKHPVMPLIKWGTAVNWMGLPNIGHELVAFRLLKIDKIKGCPLGISISADPHNHGLESLNGVLSGLNLYDKANVDFIELNESCPNVEHEKSSETVNGLDKKMIETKRKDEILIADRYFSTTLCYQTLEGIDMQMATDYAKNFEIEVPDAIFYLNVDPDIAIKRKHGEDKIKNFREKDFDFIRKTHQQYQMLVDKQVWGKWINIDGNKGIEEITKDIYNKITNIK